MANDDIEAASPLTDKNPCTLTHISPNLSHEREMKWWSPFMSIDEDTTTPADTWMATRRHQTRKNETRFHLSWSGKAKPRLQSHLLTSDIALSSSILYTRCHLRSEIGDDIDCERTKACFVVRLQQSWMKWNGKRKNFFFSFLFSPSRFSVHFQLVLCVNRRVVVSCVRFNFFFLLEIENWEIS